MRRQGSYSFGILILAILFGSLYLLSPVTGTGKYEMNGTTIIVGETVPGGSLGLDTEDLAAAYPNLDTIIIRTNTDRLGLFQACNHEMHHMDDVEHEDMGILMYDGVWPWHEECVELLVRH